MLVIWIWVVCLTPGNSKLLVTGMYTTKGCLSAVIIHVFDNLSHAKK